MNAYMYGNHWDWFVCKNLWPSCDNRTNCTLWFAVMNVLSIYSSIYHQQNPFNIPKLFPSFTLYNQKSKCHIQQQQCCRLHCEWIDMDMIRGKSLKNLIRCQECGWLNGLAYVRFNVCVSVWMFEIMIIMCSLELF